MDYQRDVSAYWGTNEFCLLKYYRLSSSELVKKNENMLLPSVWKLSSKLINCNKHLARKRPK